MSKCPTPAERARSMLRASGYATGGDVKQDKAMVRSAVRQHETAQHGGKHTPLKLARGGSVKKPSTTVNVIVAPSGASNDAQSLRGSMQRGMHAAPMGAGASPMAPPMAPPPPAAPPMNLGGPPLGMQPKPLGMGAPGGPQFKRGGKIPEKTAVKGARAKGGGIMNEDKKLQPHETDFTDRLPRSRGLAPYSGQDRAMEKFPRKGTESGRIIVPGGRMSGMRTSSGADV